MVENNATLHTLVRAQRTVSWWEQHYEIAIWQKGQSFELELRAQLGSYYPMSYKQSFDKLEAARRHLAQILARPHDYLWNNSSSQTYYGDYYRRYDDKKRGQVKFQYERPAGLDDGRLAGSIAAGAMPLPDDLSAGELVRQLWGRSELPARAALLRFAQSAPLTYGRWSHWKWLYKQAEEKVDLELLPVLISRLDTVALEQKTAFSWVEQSPSPDTFAYMKRRARRFLKNLSRQDPVSYVKLAMQVLRQAGYGRKTLDLKTQWVSLDLLFGHSGRYIQNGHGRGSYVLRQRRLSLRTQDEQVPETWSQFPNFLVDLYTNPDLPWQTLEWALKMLTVRKIALPDLPVASLLRFLQSDSPLLIRAATSQLVAKPHKLEATTAAWGFFLSNGTQRRQLAGRLAPAVELNNWDKSFAAELGGLLAKSLGSLKGKFTRRQIEVAALLAEKFAGAISAEVMLTLVPALLASRRSDFIGLVRTIVANMNTASLPNLLSACNALEFKPKQILTNILLTSTSSWTFDRATMRALVFAREEWVRQVGWRLLAINTKLDQAAVSELWDALLSPATLPVILGTATSSPAAFGLLIKSSAKIELLQSRLTAHPALLDGFNPETFKMLLVSFPWNVSLKLVALFDDNRWATLRDTLLEELHRVPARLGQFWKAALELTQEDSTGRLNARLLGDPLIAQSFMQVDDPAFLEVAQPAFGSLLVSWMQNHPALFQANSPDLLKAATHKVLEVRTWALRHLDRVGMNMPFALRLLEAGLPESFARGRQFFEALPPGDARELDFALAICDSPDHAVQAFGREYIRQRARTLPAVELTRRLAEHSDPPMQEVVAATLLQTPQIIAAPEIRQFDAQVLRSRDRGRRAKELIKKRQNIGINSQKAVAPSPAATPDLALLLELARSQTPRDAEWAMQQLVRLAQSGVRIEGLEIEGVEGV